MGFEQTLAVHDKAAGRRSSGGFSASWDHRSTALILLIFFLDSSFQRNWFDGENGDGDTYALVLSASRTGGKPRWPAANGWRLLDSFHGPWRLPLERRVKKEDEEDEGCRPMVPTRRKATGAASAGGFVVNC
ncbi:hypothetical protein V6N12_048409 [Hibiscus sabdariffa]|uniref:Uncharacterized protein n=1 Tax=Hibiscus sabdariffa TaxID=183260 RepID=A0ABR2EHM3_9ROSI